MMSSKKKSVKCAQWHVTVWWENLVSHKEHTNNADVDDNNDDL